jgi:hypothetical protein
VHVLPSATVSSATDTSIPWQRIARNRWAKGPIAPKLLNISS